MPTGFQSITSAGVSQIDSEAKCFVLKASGVATGSTYRTIEVNGCAAPLIFVSAGAALYNTQRIGSNYTWLIICADSSPVSWWVFDTIPDSTASTFGLQLFNSAGQLTFDALYPALTPYHIEPPSNGFSISAPSGRTYGIHFGGSWKNFVRNEINGGGFGNVEIVNTFLSMTISGTTLNVGANIVETITGLDPGPGYGGQTAPILMIVADLTDL